MGWDNSSLKRTHVEAEGQWEAVYTYKMNRDEQGGRKGSKIRSFK